MGKLIEKEFFAKKASLVAPKMIGLKLCTPSCEVVIVEAEAYEGKNDKASHAYIKTPRSVIMHETYAHWYVYFIYGNHYCLNITCGKKEAGAVLIREAIPVKGVPLMRKRRGVLRKRKIRHKHKKSNSLYWNKGSGKKNDIDVEEIEGLCDGPGKLCKALGIDKKYNGLVLGEKLWLEEINSREKTLLEKHLRHNHNFLHGKKRVFKHNKVFGGAEKSNLKKNKLAEVTLPEKKLRKITRSKRELMKNTCSKTKLRIIASPRIGISKAKRKKWRFRVIAK